MYLIAFAYILLDQPLLDYFGGNVAFLEEKSFKTLSPASVKLEAKRKAGNMPHAALAVTHAPLIEEQNIGKNLPSDARFLSYKFFQYFSGSYSTFWV